MKTAWRYAALLLLGSLVLGAAGLSLLRTARAQARHPQELLATQKALRRMGDAPGLAARQRALSGILARLELERLARSSDAAAFSRRLEAVFAELGLTVTSSSAWKAVPELKIEGVAAFERTFTGTGGFADLLRAVQTVESWPDQARIRALTVTPEAPGKVAWRLEVTAVRLAAREGG